MPELPEVETITRQLNQVLPGKVIEAVEVLREKSFGGERGVLTGKRVEEVKRKQKIIVIKLQDTSDKKQACVLLIHLKMTGQLIFQPEVEKEVRSMKHEDRIVGGHPTADWVGDLPSKHTRVVIHFSDGSALYFNDQRVFGWVRLVSSVEWKVLSQGMPPDVVDEAFTIAYLTHELKKSGRPIKLVILDQKKMGGMGNIYACDALFLAGIHPLKKANKLKVREIKTLHMAMITVLRKGIETGGASLSHFVDSDGIGGHYQENLLVYGRAGEPCHKCHHVIEKMSLGGRGTFFCPICQR